MIKGAERMMTAPHVIEELKVLKSQLAVTSPQGEINCFLKHLNRSA
jgi:hypothetical protein